MNIQLKFDVKAICQKLLEQKMQDLDLDYRNCGNGDIQISHDLSPERQVELEEALEGAGIYIIDESRSGLVQRIKGEIDHMIALDGERYQTTNSEYLSEKLNYSYNHLSAIFSEVASCSIESFIILKKIDRAKTLIVRGGLTISEIAFKLNYSSAAHLSTQFKKTTGLTPSQFKKLMRQRMDFRGIGI